MKLRVIGLEAVSAGVLKVSLEGKGHKGFNDKVYMYVPLEDIAAYAFGSEWTAKLEPVYEEQPTQGMR